MRIAVTGGAGFIGSRLVSQLLEQDHQVVVLDSRPSTTPGVSHRTVDVKNFQSTREALCDVEIVYHLAGPVLEQFRKTPYTSHYLQEVGTLNVLEAMRLNGIPKLILASSFYVYDGVEAGMVVSEETPLDITRMELFGASKFMSEKLVKAFSAQYGLEYVILRFGSAYGWGDCSNVIKTFIEMGLQGQPVEVWGQGTRRNQYTYVDDIAQGAVLALGRSRETYNLISPEETTTGQLAHTLRDAFGFDVVFNTVQREGASMPYMVSRKAVHTLGWQPRPVREGIAQIRDELPTRA